jgi:hypothetical protein
VWSLLIVTMSEVDKLQDARQHICIACGRKLDEDDPIESEGKVCVECFCWHEIESRFWHEIDSAFQRGSMLGPMERRFHWRGRT